MCVLLERTRSHAVEQALEELKVNDLIHQSLCLACASGTFPGGGPGCWALRLACLRGTRSQAWADPQSPAPMRRYLVTVMKIIKTIQARQFQASEGLSASQLAPLALRHKGQVLTCVGVAQHTHPLPKLPIPQIHTIFRSCSQETGPCLQEGFVHPAEIFAHRLVLGHCTHSCLT